MNKEKDSRYLDFISELESLEKQSDKLTAEDIEHWKKKVMATLNFRQKLRFQKLKLYRIEEPTDFDDDIPF